MRFSFVLPAYKARFIKNAIDSILAQSFSDFELIVVDDASPDDILSIVDSFGDERIHYYRNKANIGGRNLVAQWNHCISYAKGDYVILASDDDVYDSRFLYWMSELICKFPDLDIYRSSVSLIDENGKSINDEHFERDEVMSQAKFEDIYAKGYISSGIPQFVFRKEALDRIGGFVDFPMAWFSDDATVLSLNGKGIAVSSQARFYFRIWRGSISGGGNSKDVAYAKIQAGGDYYRFVQESDISGNVKQFLKNKIRAVAYCVINSCGFGVVLRSLIFSSRVDKTLYSFTWRLKALSYYIARHARLLLSVGKKLMHIRACK